MDIVEILDRYAEGDEFQRPIETAIEEITKLREQVAAQAAEIEKLRYSLLDVCTEVESADMLLSHGDTEGALVGVRRAHVAASLGFSLLKRINDSTVILDEVRRAEREKCAKVCDENHWDDHRLFAEK